MVKIIKVPVWAGENHREASKLDTALNTGFEIMAHQLVPDSDDHVIVFVLHRQDALPDSIVDEVLAAADRGRDKYYEMYYDLVVG